MSISSGPYRLQPQNQCSCVWFVKSWWILFIFAWAKPMQLRSSVGRASRRGTRPPGLQPGRAQKNPPHRAVPGVFFATGSRCLFLLMKYGGDCHILPLAFFRYAIKTSTAAPYIRSIYLDILLFSTWIYFGISLTLAMNCIKNNSLVVKIFVDIYLYACMN